MTFPEKKIMLYLPRKKERKNACKAYEGKMDKKKGFLSLLGILVAIIAGRYVCIFGLDENKAGSASAIKQGLDLAGGVSITYQVAGEEEPSPEDMADTVYKLQKRVEVYSTEALVYQEGNNRINIEIPGVSDANTILEELGKPGSLVFTDEEGNQVLSGTDIKEAQPATQKDNMGNSEFVVALTMTEEGAVKFAEATKRRHQIVKSFILYMMMRLYQHLRYRQKLQTASVSFREWQVMKKLRDFPV